MLTLPLQAFSGVVQRLQEGGGDQTHWDKGVLGNTIVCWPMILQLIKSNIDYSKVKGVIVTEIIQHRLYEKYVHVYYL